MSAARGAVLAKAVPCCMLWQLRLSVVTSQLFPLITILLKPHPSQRRLLGEAKRDSPHCTVGVTIHFLSLPHSILFGPLLLRGVDSTLVT